MARGVNRGGVLVSLGSIPNQYGSPVFTQQRSTSATLQACAMQPRGVYGGSASKTSLIEPMHASFRCGTKPSRSWRAAA